MVQGIDVYRKFNAVTNWQSVRNAGITRVWIKATNGNAKVSADVSPDPYVSGAKAVGIVPGLYNYCTNVAGPEADADTLVAEVARLSCWGFAPLVDYEDAGLPQTKAGVQNWLTRYGVHLFNGGVRNAYFYMPGSWWENFAPFTTAEATFGGVNFIATDAEYSVNDGTEHPRTHYTNPIGCHQYTSVGTVAGVSGNVDRDNITIVKAAKDDSEVELTDQFTYVSRNDGSTQTCSVQTALAKAADLFDQLTKGQAGTGGGPAGWWVNQFLVPDHAALAALATAVQNVDVHESAQLAALSAEGNQHETNIKAAITNAVTTIQGSIATGGVDVTALANTLAPVLAPLVVSGLPAGLTVQDVTSALSTAIEQEAAKLVPPPAPTA